MGGNNKKDSEPAIGDWQPVFDESAQEYYYWNTKTQETTWEKPKLEQNSKEKDEQNGPSKEQNEAGPSKDIAKDSDKEKGKEPSADPNADYYNSKEYYEWYMNAYKECQIQQSVAQTANSYAAAQKGNRFAELATIPGASGIDSNAAFAAREYKQMSYFFDVEKYQQERALDRMKPKVVKKYTKKELDKFKQKKHEKKVASLLQRMGPDT